MRQVNFVVLLLGCIGLLVGSLTDIKWLCVHLQPKDDDESMSPFHYHGEATFHADPRSAEPLAVCSLNGVDVTIPSINFDSHFGYEALHQQPWVAQAEVLFGRSLQVRQLAYATRSIKLACHAVASVCLVGLVMICALAHFTPDPRFSLDRSYTNLIETQFRWTHWLGNTIQVMAALGLCVVVSFYVRVYMYLRTVFQEVFAYMGDDLTKPPVLGLREGCGLVIVSFAFIFFGGQMIKSNTAPTESFELRSIRRVRATM
ncbi:MAG: hypothetical protein KVP17_000525 [Porospora cf. gigantea B]|uniref:uncharacterized protein n=1 Tax=Porospora cf. gigantea B TaxID=2853592 RepID=UPI0035719D99|nr:MAG: hypothetical protein KVP17_000525 [Porospora cf. gigantea B]